MINSGPINSFPLNGTPGTGFSVSVSEDLNIVLAFEGLPSVVASELLRISSQINTLIGDNLFEVLSVSGVGLHRADQYLTFIDSINVGDALKVAYPVVVNNAIGVDDSLSDILSKLSFAIESFSIQDSSITQTNYNKLLVELFTLTSLLSSANFAEVLSDSLAISSEAIALQNLYSTLIEFLTTEDTATSSLRLLALAGEEVDLASALSSTSNYSSFLEDGITFILTLDDGETIFKGYSYSPETFSVTEYTNYPFNSFAYVNNQYLAASSEGLYLLEGSLDEAEFITARIKTASMDLDTSNIKQVPQVYLGIDNDANLILTVSVDGKYTAQYELAIDSEDLSTQMFKIGKGLQGRYWQFTLETKENSNFDLDEIEIFPITFGRKR